MDVDSEDDSFDLGSEGEDRSDYGGDSDDKDPTVVVGQSIEESAIDPDCEDRASSLLRDYAAYYDNPDFPFYTDVPPDPLVDNEDVFARSPSPEAPPPPTPDTPLTGPGPDAESSLSSHVKVGDDDRIPRLEALLRLCDDRDAAAFTEAAERYVAVDAATRPFLERYLSPAPHWELLTVFLADRRKWVERYQGRTVVSRPTGFSRSAGLLSVAPVGLLTAKNLTAALQLRVPVIARAQVAYVEGCPQALGAVQRPEGVSEEDLVRRLEGLTLDGTQPCTCRPLHPDDPLRRGFYSEDHKSAPAPGPAASSTPTPNPSVPKRLPAHLQRETDLAELGCHLRDQGVANARWVVIDFEAAISGATYALPTEVCAAEYTLECGFGRRFHAFINPGRIPSVREHQAMNVTLNFPPTGIPFRNFSLASADYAAVWRDLSALFDPSALLVAKGPVVDRHCLQWLATRAGAPGPPPHIYDWEDLVIAMGRESGRVLADTEVETALRLPADYHFEDTCCKYHQWLQRCDASTWYHCAAEDVHAYCYALSALVNRYFPMLVAHPLQERPALGAGWGHDGPNHIVQTLPPPDV